MFIAMNTNYSQYRVQPEPGPAQVRSQAQIAETVSKAPASGILQEKSPSPLHDNKMGRSLNVLG
ncbi:MAG: hypothetical protein A2Y33_08280 [Spirochaetes bacterium GWF1_51_8]|nr:MAG: hypothetical protein A2Y33_08280 [Spirochaetes bacterium GWF1_51_8]